LLDAVAGGAISDDPETMAIIMDVVRDCEPGEISPTCTH
jgi:hypothetical protein